MPIFLLSKPLSYWLKKDVLESCELSFIWGKMRTAAWEAASQIALRDCSKVAVGERQYKVLVKGEFNAMKQSFYKRLFVSHKDLVLIDMRRFRTEIIKSVPRNYLKTCPTRFPGAQRASLYPELPRGWLKVNSYGSMGFSLHRGRWQMPLLFSRWQYSW